jgi:hypothetical protein
MEQIKSRYKAVLGFCLFTYLQSSSSTCSSLVSVELASLALDSPVTEDTLSKDKIINDTNILKKRHEHPYLQTTFSSSYLFSWWLTFVLPQGKQQHFQLCHLPSPVALSSVMKRIKSKC